MGWRENVKNKQKIMERQTEIVYEYIMVNLIQKEIRGKRHHFCTSLV